MSEDNSNNGNNLWGAVVDGIANQGRCRLSLMQEGSIKRLMIMAITEVNKVAGELGVPSAMDGIIDKEADQYIGGTESTGSNASNAGVATHDIANRYVPRVSR